MFSAETEAAATMARLAATMGRMRAASTSSSEQSAGAGAGGRKSLGGVPCSIVVKHSADGSQKIAIPRVKMLGGRKSLGVPCSIVVKRSADGSQKIASPRG